MRAGEQRRYCESAVWLLPVFAIPVHTKVLELFTALGDPLVRRRLLLVFGLALLGTAAIWAASSCLRTSSGPLPPSRRRSHSR